MDDGHPIIRIVIFAVLLLVNAIFSGTDVAMSAISESSLSKKSEEGDRKAAQILKYVHEPSVFLSTVDLIATAVAIIAGAFVAKPFFSELTGFLMDRCHLVYWPAAVISHIVVCLIIIYFVIVFSICFQNGLHTSMRKAGLIWWFA